VRHWFPFMLRDELDMLECQLTEHYDNVHRFVVVEAPVIHQGGRPKPLHYDNNKSRFAAWSDKIIHVVADYLPTDEQLGALTADQKYHANWTRERMQRDAAMAAFMPFTDPDDIVIVSDIDEIPAPAAIAARPAPFLGGNLYLRFAAVDWDGTPGVMQVLARAGAIGSIDRLRQLRESFPVLDRAGWHYSWFGGQQAIDEKLDSFCHTEVIAGGKRANAANVMYRYGMGELPADGTIRPGRRLTIPWVDSFEERDSLPWEQQAPLWVHRRLCPDIWWAPNEEAA
jgi:Glycosyltransferase family 17